jgi:hypothetical protein
MVAEALVGLMVFALIALCGIAILVAIAATMFT